MGFGTPKYGSGLKSFPRTLKDGSNVRRVLPPVLSCEATGEWAIPYATHTHSCPKEDAPDKKDYFTWLCVEKSKFVNRERVILQACPEDLLIADKDEEYKRLQTDLKEKLKNGKLNKEQARGALKPFLEWKKQHSRDFKWYVNVKDPEGNYFTEKWPDKVKKAFDKIREEYKNRKFPIDPIMPDQGLWVDIVKTPKTQTKSGFPEYEVKVIMVENEDGSQKPKLAPLTLDEADAVERSCFDLKDPNIRHITYEQAQALADCKDAPEVIRAVFKTSERKERSAPVKDDLDETESAPTQPEPVKSERPAAPATAAATTTSTATPKQEAAPTPAKTSSSGEDVMARAQAMMEEARRMLAQSKAGGAKPSAPAETKPAPTPTPAPQPTTAGSSGKPAASEPATTAPAGDDALGADLDDFMRQFDTTPGE